MPSTPASYGIPLLPSSQVSRARGKIITSLGMAKFTHRHNILTGISNGQEFQLHPCYGLNFQRVRAQRAKIVPAK